MSHRIPPLVEEVILAARARGDTPTSIARQADVHVATVHNVVRRHGDLSEALRDVQGEYFSSGFKYMWLQALDEFRRRAETGELTAQDAKNYALTAAISVDKVALVQGWPVGVVAHLHEHRHDLKGIADKLAEVARRVGAGEGRGGPEGFQAP